ncbi:hypothetical protein BDR07DRAFT_1387296 [Suillus spraguei]|nr:hypothetical protein BDR07DRAFT_1387296 [Suillus spraguei]
MGHTQFDITGGSPLQLTDILQTCLLREHPTLGTPCWYFHPCETANAVQEILNETERRSVSWMEAWFTVLSTAIDMP